MPDTPVQLAFDYGSLDTDTAQFVLTRTNEIKGLFKQTVQNIIEIGLRLIQVKECLAYGQWQYWLESEFQWTDRTARNYMQVAEQFRTENFSELDIAASALYLLASPSTPEEARGEAIARAQAGERITVASARELRDRYLASSFASPSSQGLTAQEQGSAVPSQAARLETSEQTPLIPAATASSAPTETSSLGSVSQPAGLAPTPTPTDPQPATTPPPAAPPSPPKRKRAREEKALSVTPRQVQSGEWWKLGKENYLYCGDPASAEFQKLLPQKIALALYSPPSSEAWPQSIPGNVTSAISIQTGYQEDQDLSLLREAIERFLQIYTDGGDSVVLSFLPDTAILSLIDELDCRFVCADPDPKRCDAALTVWTATGKTAEKMKTRQGKKQLTTPALSR